MVGGILTLLTALSQPTIWAQEAQQVAANQMSAQEIKWKATKPQLVYVSESPDRYAALPCIIRLQDGYHTISGLTLWGRSELGRLE